MTARSGRDDGIETRCCEECGARVHRYYGPPICEGCLNGPSLPFTAKRFIVSIPGGEPFEALSEEHARMLTLTYEGATMTPIARIYCNDCEGEREATPDAICLTCGSLSVRPIVSAADWARMRHASF